MFLSALFHVVGFCRFLPLFEITYLIPLIVSGEMDKDRYYCHRGYVSPFVHHLLSLTVNHLSQTSSVGVVRIRRPRAPRHSVTSAHSPKFVHAVLARSLGWVSHVWGCGGYSGLALLSSVPDCIAPRPCIMLQELSLTLLQGCPSMRLIK
jgi:hypothetical protein